MRNSRAERAGALHCTGAGVLPRSHASGLTRFRVSTLPRSRTSALPRSDASALVGPCASVVPRSRAGALLCASLALVAVARTACADELKPFRASYTWVWHGLTVAESKLQLQQKDDTWVYQSRSEPRGIGRVMSERPVQRSVMRITEAGVQPLSYQADDGTSSTKRDANVTFEWSAGRVTGVYEDKKVDMSLSPGVQDDLSIQIALMVALLRGHTPDRFSLLDGNSVRQYRYLREGEETLQTPIGSIATIIYGSQKEGSPRVTRFWCAPSHGFIPMKVEQKRKDEIEWTMLIESVERD